jgi:hypothetical protein
MPVNACISHLTSPRGGNIEKMRFRNQAGFDDKNQKVRETPPIRGLRVCSLPFCWQFLRHESPDPHAPYDP